MTTACFCAQMFEGLDGAPHAQGSEHFTQCAFGARGLREIERMFGVNVFGSLKVTRAFVKPMIQQKHGSIMATVSSGILFHSHGGGYFAP